MTGSRRFDFASRIVTVRRTCILQCRQVGGSFLPANKKSMGAILTMQVNTYIFPLFHADQKYIYIYREIYRLIFSSISRSFISLSEALYSEPNTRRRPPLLGRYLLCCQRFLAPPKVELAKVTAGPRIIGMTSHSGPCSDYVAVTSRSQSMLTNAQLSQPAKLRSVA